MFEAIFLALRGGKLMEWVALALMALMLLGGAYGLGYAGGAHMCVTAQAKVTASIAPKAAAAQSEKDSKDYQQGIKDGQDLERQKKAGEDKAAALKAAAKAATDGKAQSKECPPQVIPAALMEGLNDPKLIGGGQ